MSHGCEAGAEEEKNNGNIGNNAYLDFEKNSQEFEITIGIQMHMTEIFLSRHI